jgi:hypothetical protein
VIGFVVGEREPNVGNGARARFIEDGESFAGRDGAKISVAARAIETRDALESVVVRLRKRAEPVGRLREDGSRSEEQQEEQSRKEDSRFHRRPRAKKSQATVTGSDIVHQGHYAKQEELSEVRVKPGKTQMLA